MREEAMLNFEYSLPTKFAFGKGSIDKIADLIPEGSRVLMTYGGGSIKKNGVYDAVKSRVKLVCEFGGIEPNPHYETIMKGVQIAKEHHVDFVLAVGGGSVIDASKFLMAAVDYTASEDPWHMVTKWACADPAERDGAYAPHTHLKLGVVLTIPATGAEANPSAVITNHARKEKRSIEHPCMMPCFAIIDPLYTYSLPARQVRNGIVDAFVHVLEFYTGHFNLGRLQDREAEALMQTLIEIAPLNLAADASYRDRADLCLCCTKALDNHLAPGIVQCWGAHKIGHEMTTFYGLDHGQTLAISTPALLKKLLPLRKQKLAQLGRRVFGLAGDDDTAVAERAIASMEAFFESVGQPTRLSAYGLDGAHFEEICDSIKIPFAIGQVRDKETVMEILNMCL